MLANHTFSCNFATSFNPNEPLDMIPDTNYWLNNHWENHTILNIKSKS